MVYATRSKQRSSDTLNTQTETSADGDSGQNSGRPLLQSSFQVNVPVATAEENGRASKPSVKAQRKPSLPTPSPHSPSGPTIPLYDFDVKIEVNIARGTKIPPFFLIGDPVSQLRTIDAWYSTSIADSLTSSTDSSSSAADTNGRQPDRVHMQVEFVPQVINLFEFGFEVAAACMAYAVVVLGPNSEENADIHHGDALTLGYLVPSAIKDALHPLSRMDPKLLENEWIQLYGEVTLVRPYVHPPNDKAASPSPQGSASSALDTSIYAATPVCATLGILSVQVGLEPIAIQYGASGEAVDGYIDNNVEVKKSLGKSLGLARAMKAALSAIVDWKGSYIEIDTKQNTYWDRNESFYDLPPKQSTLSRHKRLEVTESVDSPATSPAKRKRISHRNLQRVYDKDTNGDPAQTKPKLASQPIGDTVTSEDLGDTSKNTYLPLDTNIASLLEACRPPTNYPTLYPASDLIVTPLLRYQAQSLHWMVRKEAVLDEDSKQTMPNWIPLRTKSEQDVFRVRKRLEIERDAVLESIATGRPIQRKKVQQRLANLTTSAETLGSGRIADEQDLRLQREPFIDSVNATFYYDQVTGILSPQQFLCKPSEPGGALCESMGLGKTLEILALIATRPRPDEHDLLSYDRSRSAKMIMELDIKPLVSRATLVVCPAALVEQWMDEINKHYRCRSDVANMAGSKSGVIRYRQSDFAWDTKSTREDVRRLALELLTLPDIIVATYEELAAQLAASDKAESLGLEVRTPLLEILFWRIVLDEAQIVSGSSGRATQMIHELWRSNCWMVTGTPVTKGIKDIQGIFAFLDHDPFASMRAFQSVIQDPFINGDVEGVRRLRAILPRYVWRHTKAHVDSEIELPPTTSEVLEIQLKQVERLFYDKEVKKYQTEFAKKAGNGVKEIAQTEFLVNLRQLLSHPQIADQLKFGQGFSRLSFVELFIQFCQKADADLETERMQVVTCILQLAWGHDFYDEERNKKRWTGGKKVLTNAKAIREVLEFSLNVTEQALRDKQRVKELAESQDQTSQDHGVEHQVALGLEYKTQTHFSWEEALYWLQLLLHKHRESSSVSSVPEPPTRWDPERPSRTFFEKAFKSVNDKTVDLDDPRFHLIIQDAGVDDMDEDELMAQIEASRANTESLSAAKDAEPPTPLPSTLDARPQKKQRVLEPGLLKKSRLRGNASQRQEGRVWFYKPKERLENTSSRLDRLKAIQKIKEHEAAFLREKLNEVQQESRPVASGGELITDGKVECLICFDVKTEIGVLPCYHAFCMNCIESICQLRGHGRCPSCRKGFHINLVTRISQQKLDSGTEDVHTVVGDWGAKITGLITDLKARLKMDSTHKAVIFSHWKKMLAFSRDALMQNGIPTVVFSGGEEAQATALRGIRDDPKIKVILVPLRASAGAAGLTLTSCDLAYLMEPALDGPLEAQAIGRIHRIGQTRPTTVVRVRVKDTVEDAVMRIAEQRSERGIKMALRTGAEDAPNTDTVTSAFDAGSTNTSQANSGDSAHPNLSAKSIASSIGSSVGVARDSDATRLTIEEVAMILDFDIEEEKRAAEEYRRLRTTYRSSLVGNLPNGMMIPPAGNRGDLSLNDT